MIFINGIYHADPHPGNILVQTDGSLVFVDFGAVACLSPAMKEGLPQLIEGILKRDKNQITDSLKMMGFMAYGDSEFDLDPLIDFIYGRFLHELSFDSWSLKDIQVDLETKLEVMGGLNKLDIPLRELMANIQIPKDFVLLERTIILLTGLCTHLQPEMNPIKTIRPYLETFVLGEGRDWKDVVGAIIKDIALSMYKMPKELNRFMDKANKGQLEVRAKEISKSADLLYTLGHQILYGLFSLVAGSMTYISYLRNDMLLINWFGSASAFFFICLMGSMWRVRRNRRKRRT